MQSVCITPPVAEELQEGGVEGGGWKEPSNSVQSVKIRCVADPVSLETPKPRFPFYFTWKTQRAKGLFAVDRKV